MMKRNTDMCWAILGSSGSESTKSGAEEGGGGEGAPGGCLLLPR